MQIIFPLKNRKQQREGEHCTICTGKVLPVLVMVACLTVDIGTVTFNLDIRRMWLFDFMLLSSYPRGDSVCIL